MKSHVTAAFRKAFTNLPANIQSQARRAFRLFLKNPDHPSLHFKPIHPARPIYSARVGRGYRAVGIWEGDEIIWFWIGSHAEYDWLIAQWRRR